MRGGRIKGAHELWRAGTKNNPQLDTPEKRRNFVRCAGAQVPELRNRRLFSWKKGHQKILAG
jgi:hypothetical protein